MPRQPKLRATRHSSRRITIERLERRALLAAVASVSPVNLGAGIGPQAHVQVTFASAMTASTINSTTFKLLDGATTVPGRISYNANNRTATIDANAPLAYSKTYTVSVQGGSSGVKDSSNGTLAATFTASFTTAPLPTAGPGGPILVVTASTNNFSKYYPEILRAEGLNAFAVSDISTVSAASLASYKLVILGEMTLTAAQVSTISTWVNGGGKLVAMKPDAQLLSLLGVSDTGATISNTYFDIDNANPIGAGITTTSMQYHGQANRYNLSGATALATLFSNATTSINNPAVTIKSVGANGGQAAMFAYDLAKSIIQTRQGNPAWSGQERDGQTPIRSDDLFFGGSSPDWVDLNKVAIPQADEQQRLLANMINSMTLSVMPMPRFWYFPNGKKALVVMTGDDHNHGGTTGRWDQFLADGTSGGQSIRGTSYMYPGTITNAAAAQYQAQGFEPGLHVDITDAAHNGRDWTSYADLDNLYTTQLADYKSIYTSVPTPSTVRTHAIVWSDYDSQPQVEFSKRIRLDTNYYYWPGTWLGDRPGMFTGSGLPMRFTKLDGSIIDVYQATTQITDESNQTEPKHINALLDGATGANGYYGAFTINAHTDGVNSDVANDVIDSAISHNIPVVTSESLLNWTDGRNNSAFTNMNWDAAARTLTFGITVAPGAAGLQTMVPLQVGANLNISTVTINGSPVSFTTDNIKGINYAFFAAASGAVSVQYVPDVTPPTVTGKTPNPGSAGVPVNVKPTVTFSEDVQPSSISFVVKDAANNPVAGSVSYSPATRTATFTPSANLTSTAAFTATVSAATDLSNNVMAGSVTWNFTTAGNGPFNLFGNTTPSNTFVADAAVELGMKFKVDIDGFITGVRFYKGAGNTGTHTGRLWSSAGTQLASLTFSGESATGWQTASFTSPVAVTAGAVYVVSYHTNTGYAADGGYFSNGLDGIYLHALSDTEAGGNGVYRYGSASGFPNSTYNATNYWVDPLFVRTNAADTTPPTITSRTPAAGATGVATSTTVTATFSEAINSATLAFTLKDSLNNNVAGATTYDSSTRVATFTPSAALANNATYTASVSASDTAGNAMTPATWSFTTVAGDVTPPTVTSRTPAAGATNVAVNTTVTATFNEAINQSTLLLTLTGPGGAVAGATSYNATTRVATFTPSAALAQGVTYTASVRAADTAGNLMPSASTWTFTTTPPDLTPPTISAQTPAPSSTNVATSTAVSATFSEAINQATLVFTLAGPGGAVAGSVSYNATTRVATFTPSAALANSATYTASISAADTAGNAMASPATWSFTTAAPATSMSMWSSTTVPGEVDSNDGQAVELGVKFRSDVAGFIKSVRFYKASTNTGTHIGSLWSSTGTRLAQATFSGETASGWQTVTFAAPIAITANTTYVASYFAPRGHYSDDLNYFATAGADNTTLHFLANGVSAGGNGVYRYGSTSGFPDQTYQSTNYWVDVVFSTTNGAARPLSIAVSQPTATTISASTTESSLKDELLGTSSSSVI